MSDKMEATNALVAMIQQRAEAGLAKYGVTLDRTDLKASDWLQHLLEELCDAGGYVLATKRTMERQEQAIQYALDYLRSSHVQSNKGRMGVLGAGDIDAAIAILKNAVPQ